MSALQEKLNKIVDEATEKLKKVALELVQALPAASEAVPILHDFILLDRSGSMVNKWIEALTSINVYVQELAKKEETKGTKITIAVFDSQGFDVVRNGVSVLECNPITDNEAYPRGMTPLYDSVVKLVALAEKKNPTNSCIVVMTDGLENASREASKETAKISLDRCRAKTWQVIFLGADFNNMQQGLDLGNMAGQTMSVNSVNLNQTMRGTASMRTKYAASGQSMSYSSKDKEEALKTNNWQK